MVNELIKDLTYLIGVILELFGQFVDPIKVGSFGLVSFILVDFAFAKHCSNLSSEVLDFCLHEGIGRLGLGIEGAMGQG